MYDLFFLSNGEPSADQNWEYVKSRWEWAKRVDRVSGIAQAHIACAKKCFTTNFFVVDADNIPDDDFPFDLKLPDYDRNFVHVWYSRNEPCNLTYGWGGIKLFPRQLVIKYSDASYVDFTTSFPLKVIPEAKSTNCFNTSAFDSWRSAFREAAKLAKASDYVSSERLAGWLDPDPKAKFAQYISMGASMGEAFSRANGDIALINNWQWLKEQFESCEIK